MKKYQNKILLVLRLFVGCLFLFSAYAKLHPMEMMKGITTFETNHLIPMGFSEISAAYFSRFIIGVEFFIGITLLFNYYLKRLIIPLSIIIITAFSIHLFTQIGSSENCGCNGELLPMKPWQALIKNAITFIILIFMYKKSDRNRGSFSNVIILFLTISTIMFAIFPSSSRSENKFMSSFTSYVKADDFDINEGRKILCFFDADCDHCQEAAKGLYQLSTEIENFPKIHIIFTDLNTDKIPDFFNFVGKELSYQVIENYIEDDEINSYIEILGYNYSNPAVIYLENGNQMRFYDGTGNNEFNAEELRRILENE